MIEFMVTPLAVVPDGAGLSKHNADGKFWGTPCVAGIPLAVLRSY